MVEMAAHWLLRHRAVYINKICLLGPLFKHELEIDILEAKINLT